MLDMQLLEKLCCADGISGDEGRVRNIILDQIISYADEINIDPLGNLLVFKKGRETPSRRLMLSAHMDEVGFIVTYINPDGSLKIESVGGINDSAVFAKQVLVGEKKLPGSICSAPIHLVNGDDQNKCPKISSLTVDIGASSDEEAKKYVSPGDSVVFDSFFENKHGRIIGKAIDDRLGCLVLIEMIKSELPYDMHFAFCVQEEVGLRGSAAAAFTIAPDSAIVIESTTAADIPGSENEQKVCCVGSGAVVSIMDRSTIYDKEYVRAAFALAAEHSISVQTKTAVAGGNDAGAIHKSRGGVRTAAISVPCRYLHSSSGLISLGDAQAVYELTRVLAEKILSE